MRGDTATDYDPTGHLLVCCEGDFDRQPLPDPQRHSLEAMLAWGVSTYGLTVDTMAGHGDYASTNCPGGRYATVSSTGRFTERSPSCSARVHSLSTSSPATLR